MQSYIRKTILFCSLTLAILVGFGHATDDKVRGAFEDRYQIWRTWVNDHPYLSTYTECEEFQAIVELGPRVLPWLVEKIEGNADDFHLEVAIQRIAKRRFDRTEWPEGKLGDAKTAAGMYMHWWKEGRFKTGERFAELHGKWKTLKSENKEKESREAYQQVVDLGIAALPSLIDKVNQEPELVAAISALSDGTLPATATPADCRRWWEENKQKFELPMP